jgi:hypothetical protein
MRYGISFAGGPPEEKMELADFPYDIFPVAELSGDMLQTSRPTRQLIFESFEALHFRNLFPAPMSRSMAAQNRSIIRMFREQLRKIMRRCDYLQVASIYLDLGLLSAASDAKFRTAVLGLFKEVTADLYGHNARLLSAVRMPQPEEFPEHFYSRLLTDAMNPFLGLAGDVHPHELAGKEYNPAEFIQPVKYDLRLLRLIYEPETGNRLVPVLVKPWVDYLNKTGLPVDLVFCPLATSPEVFEQEIFKLAEMIPELNTTD